MDPRSAAMRAPDPEAIEFVRFCYRRRRVGWPELYDEMCAVAGRGLFRGYGPDDLASIGIGFSLFGMPSLAALAGQVIAEEHALRRPVSVLVAPVVETVEVPVEAPAETPVTVTVVPVATVLADHRRDRDERSFDIPVRLTLAPTGA
jgi:hypothetical protein